jgi:hypothetical protein
MQLLMANGASKDDAAAIIGSFAQESSMDPFAVNGSHVGMGQWDKARQADFAKRYGYQIGSKVVPQDKQAHDQTLFALDELRTTQRGAAIAMAHSRDTLFNARIETVETAGNSPRVNPHPRMAAAGPFLWDTQLGLLPLIADTFG